MKREGLVLTNQMIPPPPWNNQATDRMMNGRLDDPPTADMFSKVSPKPSNHSKFTRRCSHQKGCHGCHEHPVSKSKEKAKATQKKMKNGLEVSWRVVDSGPELRYAGSSTSEFLNHLDDVGRNDVGENGLSGDPVTGSEDVEDEDNGFCDVGLFWEHVYEDAGWGLVG